MISGWHVPAGSTCSVQDCSDAAHESDPAVVMEVQGDVLAWLLPQVVGRLKRGASAQAIVALERRRGER